MSIEATGYGEKPLLIKRETCPACRMAVTMLDRAGYDYRVLSDTDPDYEAAVSRYGIHHVPTLILRPEGEWETLSGTEAIRGHLKAVEG